MVISRSKSKWAPASLIPPLVSYIELHICPYLNRIHLYKQCHEQFSKPGFHSYHINPCNHVRLLGIKYCTV